MNTHILSDNSIITLTIKQARMISGLTQAEVAEELGMHVKTYMKYENYKQIMRINQGVRFSEITGVPFNQIIFFDN